MAVTRHVVIIGAGPGRLASALLLAHAGLQVIVLERTHFRPQGHTDHKVKTGSWFPEVWRLRLPEDWDFSFV